MKLRYLLLSLLVPALICCQPAETDDPGTDDPQEQQQQQQQEPETPTPVDSGTTDVEELPTEITDGSVVLATNENMEKFLTEVTYPERDYSTTSILDYPPVAPGNSDKPQSYTIRWTPDESAGDVTVKLVDGDWSQEFALSSTDYYQTITNLRPNADYTYEAVAANGKVLTKGSFKTTGHVHHLFFYSKIRNMRDLGGWQTKDGKTVKYRMLYRGGRLQSSTLSISGKRNILAEGIKAQLDLRGKSDVLDKCALGDEYAFCNPVIEEGYSTMLQNDGAKVKQCFEFIVNCLREDKPVYYHCSLGRDRTGTLTMILLGVLGVNEGDISKEYELTLFAPHGWATSDGEKVKMTRRVDYKGAANYIWNNFTGEGESFAQGVEKYLLSIEVSQTDIDDFRSIMLE